MSTGSDENELVSLLQGCEVGMPLEMRLKICRGLLDLVENQRVRDVDKLPWKIYGFLVDSIRLGWQHPEAHLVKQSQACLTGLIDIPEFEVSVAGDVVDDGFLLQLCDRFHRGVAFERAFLRDTLHWAYANFPQKRCLLRQKIGSVLSHFVRAPSSSFHAAELLQVLRHIIKGFPENLTQVHRSLLTAVLLPLHQPNEMAVWSVQQPLLDLYHEALVGCIVPFLELQPELVLPVFEAIVAAWPRGFNGNTPKEILLLHELETLVEFVPPETSGAALNVIMPKILGCIRADHTQVVQRTLFLFKNDKFVDMLAGRSHSIFPPLLSALLRDGERSWNPTVNKMTAHVLESLERKDAAAFAAACESAWSDVSPPASTAETLPVKPTTKNEAPPQPETKGGGRLPTTLKGAMGSWRPSTGTRPGHVDARQTAENPPAAVTGVAPWAFRAPTAPTRPKAAGALQSTANRAQRITPPVQSLKRIRLDAPECGEGIRHDDLDDRKTSENTHIDTARGRVPPRASGATAPVSHAPPSSLGVSESREGEDGANAQTKSTTPLSTSPHATGDGDSLDRHAASPGDVDRGEGPGLRQVREFIFKIKPKEPDGPPGLSWQELQLEPTPTLLPDLRFHDLVFGHDLGKGSFSVVKYARHITKGKAQSQWPEFAVKVISTAKIQELNYEKSVTNEIACLRVFSHPGIARLISAFRWRDGAYLVLEYASRGDLHGHVKRHGSLSEASTRFVIGEVVAALCSIHDGGFVFGDLKPENIMITEGGHIKVADFGACRPVSEDAKNVLNRSRDALRTLRDGDWRVAAGLPPNPVYSIPIGRKASGRHGDSESESDSESDAGEQGARGSDSEEGGDVRAEGTAAYMPPEVARGGAPGLGADSWALGCVTFLCLAGRPPVYAETNEIILARVVRFASDNASDLPALPAAVSELARSLVRSLMEPDPKIRLSVEQAAKHDFLAEGGVDVFSLHREKPVELAQGSVAPTPNAAWSRRQNSMIWAPMPQDYKFEAVSKALVTIPETSVERAAFFRRPFGSVREPPVAG